ncbi:Cobalamin synthase [Pseudodesulfovibrio profundus]|uniref:Cobalamin synthase n=1 Tax=Pseudodesulfovibrio profundus TaxID=57320 RepID=A0A2C8FB27_9BACT|nr:AAA family ATPase [Pseudodesulfovibrio profundus]SOB59978.1 Cobalamin synthase [Pseudodesulfovibrio profundus]
MNKTLKELQTLQPADHDAGKVFSGKKSKRTVRGFATSSSFTPDLNPEYLFHDSSRDVVVWFMDSSDPLYVFGPAGSGKTSLIKQLAAKLNYPVFDITGHGRLEFPDMVGHLTVEDSNMSFQYGPLAMAMKFGGLFLLNEIDLLDPATAAGLNGILDGDPLCIPENGGEVIKPHPLFRFAATANTNGGTDETGLYQGTLRQNLAFMDRFWLCEIGYPSPKAERELLHRKAPGLPKEVRTKMVEFANEVRKLFMGEADGNFRDTIEVTFSTRTLIRWADLTVRFQPLARQGIQPVTYALDRALGYRATPETRTVLHELAQRIFPQQKENHS